jgi:hypothetical protein
MHLDFQSTRRTLTALCLLSLFFFLASGTALRIAAAKITRPDANDSSTSPSDNANTAYKWNVADRQLPLLGLMKDNLKPGFDQLLSYPAEQFDFPIFRPLGFDEDRGVYLLPIVTKNNKQLSFIELARVSDTNNYGAPGGIELIDKDGLKVLKTAEGTKYFFVRYPDNEFRCATIKQSAGVTLNLLYVANGLALHGVIDSSGRSLTFNYGDQGIHSLTQTWMANSEGFTKTWTIDEKDSYESSARFAHAVGSRSGKFLPANALVREYTEAMAASDKLLTQIFGGPNAVVGGNGFEPAGLGSSYPLYRGDVVGDDGKVRLGHLSHAMHIYGSPDGKGDSPLYVPAGFTSHSGEPSPTDAAVTFYYPKLGNLTDVTIAVFHVADFQIVAEGDRVRIGNIGGPGGSSPLYKHSHIEFYQGNTGLPAAAARAALRIDPATVFGNR